MANAPLHLADHVDPSRVLDLVSKTKAGALEELVRAAARSPLVEDPAALLAAVREREGLLSTGIGLGIAIPHARIAAVRSFVVAIGRHHAGLPFDSIDNKPVHIVVLIAGPQDAKKPYLELLAQISKRLKLDTVRRDILAAPTPEEILRLFVNTD